jgi:hypothetical protein
MPKSTKANFNKKRKPIIFLVCEGRNKTEKTYFNHFNNREADYRLKIVNSEATDIVSMVEKANNIFIDNEINKRAGEHVYCLVDLDLDSQKFQQYLKLKNKYRNVEIIVSNPCFEIWLLYYFTENPNVVSSSKRVKELLNKYVKNGEYSENMDIISFMKLENHNLAIDRSEKKNNKYHGELTLDFNPYTEIHNILKQLIKIN